MSRRKRALLVPTTLAVEVLLASFWATTSGSLHRLLKHLEREREGGPERAQT